MASIIIRRFILVDHMRFATYMVVSFVIFFQYSSGFILIHCIYGHMFRILL
jgi:hypothetical protein